MVFETVITANLVEYNLAKSRTKLFNTSYRDYAAMESEWKLASSNKVQLPKKCTSSRQKLLVCLGRSCRKYDSEQVFTNFKQNLPPDTELISVGCLGQCGNGPMVLVESDQEVWYSEVHPDEVPTVIKQHLIGKSPVKAMLYPKFHTCT